MKFSDKERLFIKNIKSLLETLENSENLTNRERIDFILEFCGELDGYLAFLEYSTGRLLQ